MSTERPPYTKPPHTKPPHTTKVVHEPNHKPNMIRTSFSSDIDQEEEVIRLSDNFCKENNIPFPAHAKPHVMKKSDQSPCSSPGTFQRRRPFSAKTSSPNVRNCFVFDESWDPYDESTENIKAVRFAGFNNTLPPRTGGEDQPLNDDFLNGLKDDESELSRLEIQDLVNSALKNLSKKPLPEYNLSEAAKLLVKRSWEVLDDLARMTNAIDEKCNSISNLEARLNDLEVQGICKQKSHDEVENRLQIAEDKCVKLCDGLKKCFESDGLKLVGEDVLMSVGNALKERQVQLKSLHEEKSSLLGKLKELDLKNREVALEAEMSSLKKEIMARLSSESQDRAMQIREMTKTSATSVLIQSKDQEIEHLKSSLKEKDSCWEKQKETLRCVEKSHLKELLNKKSTIESLILKVEDYEGRIPLLETELSELSSQLQHQQKEVVESNRRKDLLAYFYNNLYQLFTEEVMELLDKETQRHMQHFQHNLTSFEMEEKKQIESMVQANKFLVKAFLKGSIARATAKTNKKGRARKQKLSHAV